MQRVCCGCAVVRQCCCWRVERCVDRWHSGESVCVCVEIGLPGGCEPPLCAALQVRHRSCSAFRRATARQCRACGECAWAASGRAVVRSGWSHAWARHAAQHAPTGALRCLSELRRSVVACAGESARESTLSRYVFVRQGIGCACVASGARGGKRGVWQCESGVARGSRAEGGGARVRGMLALWTHCAPLGCATPSGSCVSLYVVCAGLSAKQRSGLALAST